MPWAATAWGRLGGLGVRRRLGYLGTYVERFIEASLYLMGRDCDPSPSGDIIGLVPRQMFFESLRSSTGLSESLIELEKDHNVVF